MHGQSKQCVVPSQISFGQQSLPEALTNLLLTFATIVPSIPYQYLIHKSIWNIETVFIYF